MFDTEKGLTLDFRVKQYGEFDLVDPRFFNNLIQQLDDHLWNQIQDRVVRSTVYIYLLEID